MNKWTCASLLAVLALSGPVGAQYYVRPPTNPYFRPQLSPYFTYYYGPGGLGGAAVVPPALARGGLPGIYPGGGVLPGGGFGTGGIAVPQGGEGQPADAQAGNVTGHPTRFMAYSQYFLNQGGGAGGVVAGSTAPAAGLPAQTTGAAIFGTGSVGRIAQPGARPPRGRENTKPGGR